jgi:hypothetical protein
MKMKRRSDRNHVIYCLVAPDGRSYIGMTVARQRAFKGSIKARWIQHIYKADTVQTMTLLSEAIRKLGSNGWDLKLLAVVRGKQDAHDYERNAIKEFRPELNMECLGRKQNSRNISQ